MEQIFVTTSGIALIALIAWFFFGKREETLSASDHHTIITDGGYTPSTVAIVANKPAMLTFIRKDSNSCLEDIIFPDYKIKEYLPLNKPVTITLNPPHPLRSEFHCAMNMFRGKLIATI